MGKGGRKKWPAWRYGPGGQRRIFQENEQIPAGWVDHPSKVKGLKSVKKLGVDANLDGTESIPEIEAAYAEGKITLEQIEAAEATRSKPRDGIAKLIQTERDRLAARAEGFAVLKEAGVEIAEDASDAELSAALDALDG